MAKNELTNKLTKEQETRITGFQTELSALLKTYNVALVPVMEKYGMKIELVVTDPPQTPTVEQAAAVNK